MDFRLLFGVELLDESESDPESESDDDDVPDDVDWSDELSELDPSLEESSLELLDELLVECFLLRFFLDEVLEDDFCRLLLSTSDSSSLSILDGFLFLVVFFLTSTFYKHL